MEFSVKDYEELSLMERLKYDKRPFLVYFSDDFKRNVLKKIADLLNPEGYLFLGASESIINYSMQYQLLKHTRGLYYQVKK